MNSEKQILGSIEVYENEIKSLRDKAEAEEDVYQKGGDL